MTSTDDRLARIRAAHPIRLHPADAENRAPASEIEAELRSVNVYARLIQEEQAHLEHSIARARFAGASWAAVGEELGITKQAAQQRFGFVDKEP